MASSKASPGKGREPALSPPVKFVSSSHAFRYMAIAGDVWKWTDEGTIVRHPHNHDVLMGRGGGSNNHVGNRWYRHVCQANRVIYHSSKKIRKMVLSKAIVAAVRFREPPGRFLEFDKSSQAFRIVPCDRAVAKTSQTLRDKSTLALSQVKGDEASESMPIPIMAKVPAAPHAHVPYHQVTPLVQHSTDPSTITPNLSTKAPSAPSSAHPILKPPAVSTRAEPQSSGASSDIDHIEAAKAILFLAGDAPTKRPHVEARNEGVTVTEQAEVPSGVALSSQSQSSVAIPPGATSMALVQDDAPSVIPAHIPDPLMLQTVPAINRLLKIKEDAIVPTDETIVVEIPQDHDVRLGRGGHAAKHPGNVWYRTLISRYRKLYQDSKKFEKMIVSKAIVFAVMHREPPGRFLELRSDLLWYPVAFPRSVGKTSQALREIQMAALVHTDPTALETNFATTVLNRLGRIHTSLPKVYPLHRYLWTTKPIAKETVKTMLEDSAAVADHDLNLPIHIACATNAPLNVVQLLIDANPPSLQAKNRFGWLPLHVACANSAKISVIQKLFDAFPMAICQPAGPSRWWLPLHVACASRADSDVVRFLVDKHPTSIGLYDAMRKLPLDLALANGANAHVVAYLRLHSVRTR